MIGSATLVARRFRLGARPAAGLALGAVAVAMVAVVYNAPYEQVKRAARRAQSVERPRATARRRSTIAAATEDNWLYGPLTHHLGQDESDAVPGRHRRRARGGRVPAGLGEPVAYGLCALVGWDASLGHERPRLSGAEALELFRSLRAPARFAVIVQLALACSPPWAGTVARSLAALRPAPRDRRHAADDRGVCGEAAPRSTGCRRRAPPVYAWLATQPRQVTLELPDPDARTSCRCSTRSSCMRRRGIGIRSSTATAATTRPGTSISMDTMRGSPDERSIEMLRKVGIQRIVVHEALYRPGEYADARRSARRRTAVFHLTHVSSRITCPR